MVCWVVETFSTAGTPSDVAEAGAAPPAPPPRPPGAFPPGRCAAAVAPARQSAAALMSGRRTRMANSPLMNEVVTTETAAGPPECGRHGEGPDEHQTIIARRGRS